MGKLAGQKTAGFWGYLEYGGYRKRSKFVPTALEDQLTENELDTLVPLRKRKLAGCIHRFDQWLIRRRFDECS